MSSGDRIPMREFIVEADDVMVVSRIVAGVVGRGLSPSESSRLRMAWRSASPATLIEIADQLDSEDRAYG